MIYYIFIYLSCLFFLFCKISFASNDTREIEIKELEKKLFQLQNMIENKEKELKEINRIFINIAIKLKINEKSIYNIINPINFKKNKERYTLNKILYSHIKTSIENERNNLSNLKKEYKLKLNKLKREKLLYSEELSNSTGKKMNEIKQKVILNEKIIDPITKENISQGKFNKRVEPGRVIYSPQDGIIKRIQFILDNFAVLIENQKCTTYIHGLGLLRVNLGDVVKAGQPLGEAGFSEDRFNLYYEIECKR